MTLPLTERQENLWRYIKSCERSPSYDEMCAHMGYRSKSQIESIVVALKAKGFVNYMPGRARSIVAIDPAYNLSNFTTAELAQELSRRLSSNSPLSTGGLPCSPFVPVGAGV